MNLDLLTVAANPDQSQTWSISLQVLLFMTVLSVLPALLMTMTSFTRIVIVLAILRQGLGTQQTPSNSILVGVALILTVFVMSPVFVEVVRRYVEQRSTEQSGWLAGLMDPAIGRALVHLHEHPERAWNLADLAREVATSRTVLVERFTRLVGVPPMCYLTRWRVQLAAQRLSRGTDKVAAIGAQVGYDSEAAFSRAFKRETGLSPAAWRRAHQAH